MFNETLFLLLFARIPAERRTAETVVWLLALCGEEGPVVTGIDRLGRTVVASPNIEVVIPRQD